MTAEAAVVLPLLLAVTVGMLWLLAVAAGQIRLIDAARETARSVARGDSATRAVELGRRVAPDGADLAISTENGRVVVTATASVVGPGGIMAFVPSADLRAEAVALVEAPAVIGSP